MSLSPMMKHYMQTKDNYKDCILFYRLGDFYEMFFDDAIKVSEMIGLTLTGRDCGLKEKAPMCGVPYHSADTYITKLVKLGEKVAICEQLTTPQESKGIVERGVVRVVTAGTLIEENQLEDKENNFLVSVYKNGNNYAYSYADITTGEFVCSEVYLEKHSQKNINIETADEKTTKIFTINESNNTIQNNMILKNGLKTENYNIKNTDIETYNKSTANIFTVNESYKSLQNNTLLENSLKNENYNKKNNILQENVVRLNQSESKQNYTTNVKLQKESIDLQNQTKITYNENIEKANIANHKQNIIDILIKLKPAEIITNLEMGEEFKDLEIIKQGILPKFFIYSEWAFGFNSAEKALKAQFNVTSLDAYGISDKKMAIQTSGALITYLKETQKHSIKNINSLKFINDNDFLVLDYNAVRNLELNKSLKDSSKYGSLLWLIDKTSTSMGGRMLNNWLLNPLGVKLQIENRLDTVNELYNNTLVRQSLKDSLKDIKDLERLAGKVSNNNLNPRDCIALSQSLQTIPVIKMQLSRLSSDIIRKIDNQLVDLSAIVKLINLAIEEFPPTNIKDGGYIKKGFNKELDELRGISSNAKSLIAEIESREREETKIKTLKIGYNRVFGYYIEVTNSFKEMVPYKYIRRQTLTNAERYITEELKVLEEKILGSQDKILKIESSIFSEIKESFLNKIPQIQTIARAVGYLDCLISLAIVAKQNNYCKPEILEPFDNLNIVGGRHPVIESISKEKFITNNTLLNVDDNRTAIITGPNMAGKSTYMRQIALISLMAHIGSYVPAVSAEIPLIDRIFTRIGASDNLINDQSTFMVEMTEVAHILHNATIKSLIILDEVGRGTSTYDGLSIAWSVLEYITKNIKAKTLFATHYHELTELEGKIFGVKNYKVTVKECGDTILFLRKIMRGGANKSFGIEVASMAGVPNNVTLRAKEILKLLENADITQNDKFEKDDAQLSESAVEKILKDLDIDNISPINAFNILSDLINKVTGI